MARGQGCKSGKSQPQAQPRSGDRDEKQPRFHVPKVGETIESGPWEGFEVIYVYSREQALHDGVIVDVSEMAREAGYRVPVALTAAVAKLVTPSEDEADDGQDRDGRLWDVLWMARASGAAQRVSHVGESHFQVYFQIKGRPELRGGMRLLTLKVTLDATGEGHPALTLSLPSED